MVTRRLFVTAAGTLVGLALGLVTLSAASARLEYLTFSGPVALPGVTLHAATYSFQVLDHGSPGNVVSVRNRATHQPVFLGLTLRVDRPAGAKRSSSVVFGEAPRGVPRPIVTWYPAGESTGYQFMYSGR